MEDNPKKFHIAVFPWLAFGHISPFFELSKLIAEKGHKISFISTPRNIKRLPKLPPNLQPLVNFVELSLPHIDQLPEHAEATMDIPSHLVPYLKKAFDGLQQPLIEFLEKSNPDCVIYDFAPYWLSPILSKFGILSIFFSIFTAFGMCFGVKVMVGKSNDEDNIISADYLEQNESGVTDVFRVKETLFGADFIAARSCMEIEGKSLESIENLCKKKVIPVGLLPPSLQIGEEKNDENWDTILKWLDKHEKRSVVYVAFGSEVTLSDEEFTEIAKGLELSSFPYLWILKNQVKDDWLVENQSNKKGLIWSNWAPQLRILSHESIGGFLTHCGWSSVIESLQVGCPLIMLPFNSEQDLNAIPLEEKMVGVKVQRNDEKFNRDSVAKAMRSVMLKDEGESYRSKAEEMSKIVGDKELHQKYIDDFVDYVELHILTSKH
ncbi:putative soyasaponin III rhamnosyltransferase [Medicago truncatula]|uniref:Glycosyltransferase n=1 Tax=Medicago truncatula TaxID=3880 RepID=A0A396H0X1_MEDTR|nr:putative UDP-rhamnose:rhamnosyltransferase 1 [Medicago truncatula]RHN46398.1 putative soyasaponin III rhamnosyltransferase [Medicago truncatula]